MAKIPIIQLLIALDLDKARILLDAKIKSTEPCVELKQVNKK